MRPQLTYNRLQSFAYALHAYRAAARIDATNGGECGTGYDDACDELGQLTDDGLRCASAIVATDPVAWSQACEESESRGESVAELPYLLAGCITNGEDANVPGSLMVLFCCDAAVEWRNATATDAARAAAEALAKENEEKNGN